jgi:N-acyl-D-aspartate/D-glutamate deacylase
LLDEIITSFNKMFRLGEPANYEPGPEMSALSESKRMNISPEEVLLDMLLEKEGNALIYHPLFNYEPGNLDHVETMLNHPHTIFGLGDAGAHCGAISDASFPTTLLQHWGRDRTKGNKFPLERLIKMQTSETSELLGILDRGALEVGLKADINIIDFKNLTIHEPEIIYDLPAGGKRLMQKASGYEYTIVSGEVAFKKGEATGALNGKLIRNLN